MDGSDPTKDSDIYKAPILIGIDNSNGIVIKACVYKNDTLGEVTTEYYQAITEDLRDLSIICLIVDPSEMLGIDGIYKGGHLFNAINSYGHYNPFFGNFILNIRLDVVAFFELEDGFYERKGKVRLRGGSSRIDVGARKSLSIEMGEPVDFMNMSVNCLRLRSTGGGERYLYSKVDYFIESICSELDVGATKGELANLYINGEYWGIYALQEDDDSTFWSRHYGIDESKFTAISYDINMLT